MASNKVIVFGPTGNVGSVAALVAQEQGAKVYLAMRDTQKAIPNLTAAQEHAGGFERVQADLRNPDSIRAAVAQTAGATRAFLYITVGSPDNMRSAIEALKEAGIEFVVFLSSFSVEGDLRRIQPSEFTAYAHSRVEINLEEVFGPEGYVAVRPGFFTSNLLLYRTFVAAGGVVRMPYPEVKFDCIATEDIGRVAGVVLAKGQWSEPIYLAGPQLISQADAIGVVATAVGKQLKVENFENDGEAAKFLAEKYGVPEAVGEVLVKGYKKAAEAGSFMEESRYNEAAANIKKYGLKEPTRLEAWVEQNKAKFLSDE